MSLGRLSADERDVVIPYLRGLETYAACQPTMTLAADVIDLADYQRTRRVQAAVLEQRRAAIASARKIHQQQERRLAVDEFAVTSTMTNKPSNERLDTEDADCPEWGEW